MELIIFRRKYMKKFAMSVLVLSMLGATGTSFAWWDSDNDRGPWGGGNWNPYDEWDPRYWMEEMENEWDDDDDYYRRGYYGGPYGGYGAPYGGGYAPYGGYGYGAPAPYGGGYAPYGGGYAPYGGGYAPPGGGYAPSGGYNQTQPAPAAPTQQYGTPQPGY